MSCINGVLDQWDSIFCCVNGDLDLAYFFELDMSPPRMSGLIIVVINFFFFFFFKRSFLFQLCIYLAGVCCLLCRVHMA